MAQRRLRWPKAWPGLKKSRNGAPQGAVLAPEHRPRKGQSDVCAARRSIPLFLAMRRSPRARTSGRRSVGCLRF